MRFAACDLRRYIHPIWQALPIGVPGHLHQLLHFFAQLRLDPADVPVRQRAVGNMACAQRIAWIGALTGGMFMETIGVLAAVFPKLWIRLFSSDPAVIESGVSYLRIAGPFYGAIGTTFILGFAAQGLGRPMWPMLAGTARSLFAGAVGWVAVSRFGANMPGLFGLVSLASMAAVLICVGAARSGRIWAVGIK